MSDNNQINMTVEERREVWRQMIKYHSPPASKHDAWMIMIYQNLLNQHEEVFGFEGQEPSSSKS